MISVCDKFSARKQVVFSHTKFLQDYQKSSSKHCTVCAGGRNNNLYTYFNIDANPIIFKIPSGKLYLWTIPYLLLYRDSPKPYLDLFIQAITLSGNFARHFSDWDYFGKPLTDYSNK